MLMYARVVLYNNHMGENSIFCKNMTTSDENVFVETTGKINILEHADYDKNKPADDSPSYLTKTFLLSVIDGFKYVRNDYSNKNEIVRILNEFKEEELEKYTQLGITDMKQLYSVVYSKIMHLCESFFHILIFEGERVTIGLENGDIGFYYRFDKQKIEAFPAVLENDDKTDVIIIPLLHLVDHNKINLITKGIVDVPDIILPPETRTRKISTFMTKEDVVIQSVANKKQQKNTPLKFNNHQRSFSSSSCNTASMSIDDSERSSFGWQRGSKFTSSSTNTPPPSSIPALKLSDSEQSVETVNLANSDRAEILNLPELDQPSDFVNTLISENTKTHTRESSLMKALSFIDKLSPSKKNNTDEIQRFNKMIDILDNAETILESMEPVVGLASQLIQAYEDFADQYEFIKKFDKNIEAEHDALKNQTKFLQRFADVYKQLVDLHGRSIFSNIKQKSNIFRRLGSRFR